jgi:hypothetical protein
MIPSVEPPIDIRVPRVFEELGLSGHFSYF